MSTPPRRRATPPARPAGAWLRDLRLGARLAAAGGRSSWARTAMTALGVGLGVALLLLAASTPSALDGRDRRSAARDDLQLSDPPARASDTTLLIADVGTSFRGHDVRGRLVRAEGPRAPVPPGLDRLPGRGEAIVSPALRSLLRSGDGALLRPRIPGRIVGTIGDDGLTGARELAFYAGDGTLRNGSDLVRRIDGFGGAFQRDGLPPVLVLLVLVTLVVLLVPVAVFLAAAVRFGGEGRDRRLAALSLVGADRRMVRRIAAGESLLGALLGLGAGGLLFLLAGQAAERISVDDLTIFASDLRPAPEYLALIVVAVPVLAVVVTQFALGRVAVDPLGVVRRGSDRRRRVWWRLLPPVAGLALLVPMLGLDLSRGDEVDPVRTTVAIALLLVGVTAVLPWLVEAVVSRLRGGGVPWLLAVRRLQADSGTSARVVSGIAVAVAGALALQTVFVAVEDQSTVATGADTARFRAEVQASVGPRTPSAAELTAAVERAGARRAQVTSSVTFQGRGSSLPTVSVASCTTLRRLAAIERCTDGDGFRLRPEAGSSGFRIGEVLRTGVLRPRADGSTAEQVVRWRVPRDLRTVASRPSATDGGVDGEILLTPAAARRSELPPTTPRAVVGLDPGDAALERLRNAAAALDPLTRVSELTSTRQAAEFVTIRRGILVGAIALLVLIGTSLLVGALEQLHERRRLLASLVAVGTPPSTLRRSILLQTAVPVVLGLAVAVVTGLGLGAILLRLIGEPLRVDVASTLAIVGVGAAVVPLVTALSAPALARILRPEGLRTE